MDFYTRQRVWAEIYWSIAFTNTKKHCPELENSLFFFFWISSRALISHTSRTICGSTTQFCSRRERMTWHISEHMFGREVNVSLNFRADHLAMLSTYLEIASTWTEWVAGKIKIDMIWSAECAARAIYGAFDRKLISVFLKWHTIDDNVLQQWNS